MYIPTDIIVYNNTLAESDAAIANLLFTIIETNLTAATCKVWHGHPVWFIHNNPIVGYHKLKKGMRLLFWSGQSFTNTPLTPEGKFMAAEIYFNTITAINETALITWLQQAITIQWDYKNIVKRKGVLLPLTTF